MDIANLPPEQALAALIDAAVRRAMIETRTHVPATVISFERSPRAMASVRVDVLARLRSGETVAVPQLDRIPVLWPAGGGFAMDADLRPGDQVLLEVFDRDISAWLTSGEVSAPATGILSSLSCSAALAVGLRSEAKVGAARPGVGALYIGDDSGAPPWLRLGTVPTASATVEAPSIFLGEGATLGVARMGDTVAADVAGTTLLTNIQLALVALGAIPVNAPASAAIAAVTAALPAGLTGLGKISSASTVVKSV